MKYVPFILLNLSRNARRSVLTLVAIALSLFLFSALASVATVPEIVLRGNGQSTRLVCHNAAGLAYMLPQSYVRKIAVLPHVRAVQAWEFFAGSYRSPKDDVTAYAMDPETLREMWPEWGISPTLAEKFAGLRTAALVGPALMEKYHWQIGQTITLRSAWPLTNLSFQIVGMLHGDRTSTGTLNMIVVQRDYYESLIGSPGLVSILWVRVDEQKC